MSCAFAAPRALSIVASTLSTIGALLLLRWRHADRPALLRRESDRLGQRWARSVGRRIGMRVVVEGEPPDGPCAIVANHLGYLDIVALWCVVPGVFVARADLAGWPLIGVASRLVGTIPIDRGRKRDLLRVLPELTAALAAGRNVLFFPEATSSRGATVLPFRSPLFEAAVRRAAPVVGVGIHYVSPGAGAPAAERLCWWGDMPFVRHVFDSLRVPRFEVHLRFSGPIEAGDDRKALCRLARDAVVKGFAPTAAPAQPSLRASRPRIVCGSGQYA
ncbi:MAG: lysophospholipid acyltransferase family protein [Myxococcota bacterium]